MKRNKILVVGAGREGKGFLGQVYAASGWEVIFLDKNPDVVHSLQEKGSYKVKLLEADQTVVAEVSGYRAYVCDEECSCLMDIVDADVIALCLYPEDIKEAAEYLARGLEERAKQDGKEVTILSCTNLNHIISEVEKWFYDPLSEQAKEWFTKNAVVRDVIVRRSTSADASDSLKLESMAVESLLIQKPVNVDLSKVIWMELTDDLEKLKEVKLYTYNAPHATCAYAGYLKGYNTIGEAENDPEIRQLMNEVLKEAIKALALEFQMEESKLWEFCTLPAPKEVLVDYIYRVAYDPVRKLGRNDRLTGNACFCYKHGLPYDALAQSIANGFAYSEERDEKAQKIQQMIRKCGIEDTVSQVCGLPKNHEIAIKVINYYQKLIDERRTEK